MHNKLLLCSEFRNEGYAVLSLHVTRSHLGLRDESAIAFGMALLGVILEAKMRVRRIINQLEELGL
ncbi:hypothetical protein [Argonema antarcticum]|uniref:hypothetical protein n=1 Tax=Argonema antarcticum TaxID=2942763 RepID=UPI0020116198|nr:hypothetical protein [Argonema antarcticum]MCL1473639.1 hypothetical protein [Argonema antarcticum A004/B2]